MAEQYGPIPPRRFYRNPEEDHNPHDDFMGVPSLPGYLARQGETLRDVRRERGSFDEPGYRGELYPPILGKPYDQDDEEFH